MLPLPLLVALFSLLAYLLTPSPTQAQGSEHCTDLPQLGYRLINVEETPGNMVYVVCVDLTNPNLSFQTIMANGTKEVNPSPDQRETVISMVQEVRGNPVIAFNADYFGAGHGPEGLTVIEGDRIDGPDNGDWDSCPQCRDNGVERASLSISRLNAIEISHKGPTEVINNVILLSRFFNSVGGGPMLVRDRTVIPDPCRVARENVDEDDCYNTRQTAVGVSEDGTRLIIVVAESRTGEQMGDLLVEYGAEYGLKLDGGPSSQLWVDPEGAVLRGQPIANAILVFREEIPRHDAVVVRQSEFPIVAPGDTVKLDFILENTGFLIWEEELPYRFRFAGGERLGLYEYYDVRNDVGLGDRMEWSDTVIAPQEPGAYQMRWQLIYEEGPDNVELIGPEVGFVITVLPEGASPNLEVIIRQIVNEAEREVNEALEEFLSDLEAEIERRINEGLRNMWEGICPPLPGMVLILLVLNRRKRRDSR
jgi:exopolysaccharide biosynthesis protein